MDGAHARSLGSDGVSASSRVLAHLERSPTRKKLGDPLARSRTVSWGDAATNIACGRMLPPTPNATQAIDARNATLLMLRACPRPDRGCSIAKRSSLEARTTAPHQTSASPHPPAS